MSLRQFFIANYEIFLFLYGQVFFVMGLAIVLQSRRYSQLDLARSLSWLGAFGIIHGIYEWGDILIPLQTTYLSELLLRLLSFIYLLLLSASFACLFAFGVLLLHSLISPKIVAWLRWMPLLSFTGWFLFAIGVLNSGRDFGEWQRIANAASRYLIGFPGAMLTAYALRRHALERIAPLGVPQIVNSLRISGIAVALYGVFAGLIVPRIPYVPAIWINSATFQDWTGIPVILLRSLTGLVLLVTIVRALEVFDVETARLIEAMEQQQILIAERNRIGRELHDGAIQMIYTAGLLVESAQTLTPADTPLAHRLSKAVSVINDAITSLRHNLGELRSGRSSDSLIEDLQQLATDARFTSFVNVMLETSALKNKTFSVAQTDHLVAIVNEALSNVVRHARARHVDIKFDHIDSRLRLIVQDDGVGIPKDLRAGYGLRNMRDRARLLGGKLDIANAPKHGSLLTLDVPFTDEP